MAKIYATKNPKMCQREKINMERSRKIASQGMVLLENDGVLPIESHINKIAVYGSGVRRTVKGGTGSGDVNSRMVVNVEQGLIDAGFLVTTGEWLDRYDVKCKIYFDAYMDKLNKILSEKGTAGFTDILADPYRDPDVLEITQQDINSSDTDVAIYVLARTSGEGKDRNLGPGDYELSKNELQNIEMIAESYKKTIVILNVGGVIDTKVFRYTDGINAVLLMSQAGNISGWALADVLTGKVTPCGHLAATWAENYLDYPCADKFSYMNGNIDDEYYEEGIYVGYRYFDSFGVKPAYPFGYGGSYTTFSLQTKSVSICGNNVEVQVAVSNIGKEFSGKEVVQVYYSAPEGSVKKTYQELAGFAKTNELAPGESQVVKVVFRIQSMASYVESRAAYILDTGKYYIRVGNHSRNTHIAAALKIEQEIIVEVLKNKLVSDYELKQLSAQEVSFYTYQEEKEEKKNALVLEVIESTIPTHEVCYGIEKRPVSKAEHTIAFDMVLAGKSELHELVEQLTVQEMAEICVGTARGGFGSTSIIGAASTACPGAAGDTTSLLTESKGIPNIVLADGPAGLRLSKSFVTDNKGNIIPGLGESAFGGTESLFGVVPPKRPEDAVDYYQYCTAIPIATMLAQTWDQSMIEEAGDIVGEEMEEFGVTLWLAPGMNIQRNPLCGRNFEYYSEDPFLAGVCAAADTRGVQKHPGCGTTIKHFALNNQEDNRAHNNAHCGERAIREIYLKGFEIAIKDAHPLSVMSSYNLLNGEHTANSYDLLTSILRDEWKFEGIVMTDWGTTGGGDMTPITGTKYGYSSAVGCIKAGNDLIMPGSQQDVDAIVNAIENPESETKYPIFKTDLQRCTERILRVILESTKEQRIR